MGIDNLKIIYKILSNDENSKRKLIPSLWINDECISKGVTVDMRALAASVRGSGQYDILTCSCGEPGCAGIWEGIIAIHLLDVVCWLIPQEKATDIQETDGGDILTVKRRYFRKEDYVRTIVSAIETAQKMVLQDVERAETVPYGFTIDELLQMQIDEMQ